MTTKDLKQYRLIKREIQDLQQRIAKETKVTDVVEGSLVEPPYIKHPISITGDDYCSDKLKARYRNRIYALKKKAEDIEDYIQTIDDSLVRQIIRYHFIDGLTWTAVAAKVGGGNTADSVKQAFSRYMRK